ncbi:Queuine tRNA-ribosyltransferase accessory subunit 2 [Fusarium oxysporum f. sp. albedinis]|nr:Queuine tRNA-ribosyltransferase accessory subunit 2 [Fusarium oxysporum f. sp. albedinis]
MQDNKRLRYRDEGRTSANVQGGEGGLGTARACLSSGELERISCPFPLKQLPGTLASDRLALTRFLALLPGASHTSGGTSSSRNNSTADCRKKSALIDKAQR